ncbi:MAG: hypothetical protein ACYC7E_20575 [Armatimonadota bacterium]
MSIREICGFVRPLAGLTATPQGDRLFQWASSPPLTPRHGRAPSGVKIG